MSTSMSNPTELYPLVELNFKCVFLRNPFPYNHGIKFTFTDHDFVRMTYSECITFPERFMQESIKKLFYYEPSNTLLYGITPITHDEYYDDFIFDDYRTDGIISLYVDHVGEG
ncbi:unnamed protein product [Lactuca virosa]|uniref:Uncharacterized protein n=1 Tax=Lactuca virosa TaxID=75947 RepID=A0AAU9MW86_9ASTR|nr:unnamed protein product [Lactuca virosa]